MQLIDFAPTVFDLMGYKIPPVMKGRPVYGPNLEGKLSK
jgi:bisphosphoglycerate-independent phosphoglycerate mutase (AlkP superfamily)